MIIEIPPARYFTSVLSKKFTIYEESWKSVEMKIVIETTSKKASRIVRALFENMLSFF